MSDLTTAQQPNTIKNLLSQLLPSDVLTIEHLIKEHKFNNDEFAFSCDNPEKKFIGDLNITYKATGWRFKSVYDTNSNMYKFRMTPGIHVVNQPHHVSANHKGPQFKNVEDFFKSWLTTLRVQVDSINRISGKDKVELPLIDNEIHNPSKIEFIFDENDSREVTERDRKGINEFTQWLLPQAEEKIGKGITQQQYDDLKRRVEELESKTNQPGAKNNIVGGLFKKVMEHEVLSALSPYLHEYVGRPVWEGLKMYLNGLNPFNPQ